MARIMNTFGAPGCDKTADIFDGVYQFEDGFLPPPE
jgi:hypothetical protein